MKETNINLLLLFTDSFRNANDVSSTSTKVKQNIRSDYKDSKKDGFLKHFLKSCFIGTGKQLKGKLSATATYEPLPQDDTVDVSDFDWWTKFYASIEVDHILSIEDIWKFHPKISFLGNRFIC